MNFDDYKKGILAAIESAKAGKDSDYLDHPSPARLREYCGLLMERGLPPADREIFVKFFGGGADSLAQTISGFDIDKMRPIQNFLNQKSDLTRTQAANLAAVIVGMQPRPFAKFREGAPAKSSIIARLVQNSHVSKRRTVWLPVLAAVTTAVGVSSAHYFTVPECMAWDGTRYVETPCDGEGLDSPGETLDQDKLEKMRKIVPCDTVTFFRNERPVVWYDKHKKKVEFFTMPGLHPVSGRTLKPVTAYMVDKYAVDCK